MSLGSQQLQGARVRFGCTSRDTVKTENWKEITEEGKEDKIKTMPT
jgi:hypothetical protein